jgi:lipopolysaccharide export system protein LptA
LHEVDSDKKIFGDEIIVDQLKGVYSVKSKDKKPVKFIFQVEDK